VKTIDHYRWRNITFNSLLYPDLLHSTPPHSHSIVLSHVSVLIYLRKFFLCMVKTRRLVRQKLQLLIFKANFGDSKSARFRLLSGSIG
jgi:hypothetical protein